jgi:tetratricopeptide (TPR) repeat protein
MSLLRRLFSADYRRALAAEAAGDYAEAARAYALAGERAKVAEMHLFRAERATSADGHLKELRAGLRWADLDDSDGRAVRRRLARGLVNWARKSGLYTEGDRQVAREAAQLFAEVGDFGGAGECHELVGEDAAAAEAYQRAGELDRLERVLEREETRRRRILVSRDAFEEYRLHLQAGAPWRALKTLQRAVDGGSGDNRGELDRLLSSLRSRLVTGGAITLHKEGRLVRYIGRFPFSIGRESECGLPLRDPNISRRHAQIDQVDGAFVLSDLESKNGTRLSGLPVGGGLPLVESGEIGVGDAVGLKFCVEAERLHLDVVRGLDRGLEIVAGRGPLPLLTCVLDFVEGRARVRGGGLLLNGGAAPLDVVELCSGDVLQIDGSRIEVR